MGFKTMLVHVDTGRSASARLKFSADLAARFAAHVTGLYVRRPFQAPALDADDDELRAYIAEQTMTIYHPTSSCAIGPVVDLRLRVHGVDGLRVVDASVMPTIVRGNTNAPTIMIAEKAADLIREDAAALSAASTA